MFKDLVQIDYGDDESDGYDSFEPHDGQRRLMEIVQSKLYTFIIVPCARRWGKSETIAAIENAVVDDAFVGPYDEDDPQDDGRVSGGRIGIFTETRADATQHWDKIIDIFGDHIIHKPATARRIITDVGGLIWFFTIPNEGKKNSGRGEHFTVIVYEEFQNINDAIARHHFQKVVLATMLDYPDAICIVFGTPNGQGTYFHEFACRGAKNGIAENVCKAENDLTVTDGFEKWITFRARTKDNPLIDPVRLREMRKEFDSQTARQEIDAEFIEYAGEIWCVMLKSPEILRKVFVTGLKVDWQKPIYLNFDFNKQPMTCSIMQLPELYQTEDTHRRNENNSMFLRGVQFKKTFETNIKVKSSIYDMIRQIQEYVFRETGVKIGRWYKGKYYSKARQDWILEKSYPNPFQMFITGDASGDDDGDGKQKVARSFYDIICEELCINQRLFARIPKSNPRHHESYIQYNFYLERCPIFQVDSVEAKHLKDDMLAVKSDKFRGIVKSDSKLTHHLDHSRYGLNTWKDFICRI